MWKSNENLPRVFIQDNSFTVSPSVSNVNQPNVITETLFIGLDLQLDSGIFIIRKRPIFNGINSLSIVYFDEVSHSSSTLCHFPHWGQITDNYSTHLLLLQTKRYFICHWYVTHFQSNTSQHPSLYFSKSSCLSDIQLCWCQTFQTLSIRKRLCFINIFICKPTALHKENQNKCLYCPCMSPLGYIHI